MRIHRIEPKLARARQDDALEPWHATLNGIMVDKALSLLESIDAARASTSVDNDGGLNLQQQQHIPLGASDAIVVPVSQGVQYIGSSNVGGNQMQMKPAADGINCTRLHDKVSQAGPLADLVRPTQVLGKQDQGEPCNPDFEALMHQLLSSKPPEIQRQRESTLIADQSSPSKHVAEKVVTATPSDFLDDATAPPHQLKEQRGGCTTVRRYDSSPPVWMKKDSWPGQSIQWYEAAKCDLRLLRRASNNRTTRGNNRHNLMPIPPEFVALVYIPSSIQCDSDSSGWCKIRDRNWVWAKLYGQCPNNSIKG
uniref:Uncharacterized protein n=1 Tax=Oryza punctata TaxID=4537 RepID=A0A0E0LSF2_ORYPU